MPDEFISLVSHSANRAPFSTIRRMSVECYEDWREDQVVYMWPFDTYSPSCPPWFWPNGWPHNAMGFYPSFGSLVERGKLRFAIKMARYLREGEW